MRLLEAVVLLGVARLALRTVPVRFLVNWVERRNRQLASRVSTVGAKALLQEVHWAVTAGARNAPVGFVCFPQCLAAGAMLHARGIPSVLHYGVARVDGKLSTHTWLEAEGRMVIGGDVAKTFSRLASYGPGSDAAAPEVR